MRQKDTSRSLLVKRMENTPAIDCETSQMEKFVGNEEYSFLTKEKEFEVRKDR